ncbi:Gustatory receptor 71b [Halyomorpha halys]|nr:Gustatory receptor 71b [Halyomorpha halys]
MSGNPPKSFEHNVIFRVSAFFGLFPFANESSFQLKKSLFVYSIAFTTVVTVVGGLSVLNDLTQMSEIKSYYFNLSIGVVYTAGLILVFPCSLACAFLNRGLMQKTFQAMKDMQSTFKTMKLSRFNNRTHLLPFLDILVLVWCSVLIYLTYSDLFYTTYGTCFSLSHLGISLICGQFCFLVDLTVDIFDKGIEFLNEMKLSLIIKRHSRRIFEVVKAINQLGSVSCSLNDVFALQILVITSLCFVGISIHIYYFSLLVSAFIDINLKMLLFQVYSFNYYVYVSWRINQSCAETSEKWKEFNTVLYQLMIDDKTDEIFNNDKLRMHILMKRELVFNACGFFNLDMIASATTYLVILIQFGRPEIIAR